MSKEITKAFILQQIQDKFGLRELSPEIFRFSEEVMPVYNIENHVQTWISEFAEVSITATGGIEFFEVPQTERWYLRGYNVLFMGVADQIKVSGVYLTRVKTPTSSLYLDLVKAQAISYAYNLPTSVTLNAGDKLKILVDTYVSTQDLRLYIDYMKEEIR